MNICYDSTMTRIFDIPPYYFFAVIGIVFATSLFIVLLLKNNRDVSRYSRLFLLSGFGLLFGAKTFGCLTGLYIAIATGRSINFNTITNTGIVFYGGVFGLILSFLLMCKTLYGKNDRKVLDLVAVCIPVFSFWGRLGCFFGGCCFGIESQSRFSVLYTTKIYEDVFTARRVPVQLLESFFNLLIFIFLFNLLNHKRLEGKLLNVYLCVYSSIRLVLEFYRGDWLRGIWNGVSFSQIISVIVLAGCAIAFLREKTRKINEP